MAGGRPADRESGAPRVSILLRAVQRGDYGVLTNLLGSSNGEDHEGNANLGLLAALLVEACGREHLDCIELLLQRMMKPSPKRNLKRRGYFPMHTAAGTGATESIELLLSAGLSPKTRDRSGRTPLHIAAAQGSAECVSLLCAVARSTVMSRDRATGDTPVHFAVRARNGVCIEVLLSFAQGNDDILRVANAKGETPLDIANALGDTSLVLRSGHVPRGGGRGRSEDGTGFERIMAVWERFFENAAVACVGGRETPRASGVPSRNQRDQVSSSHHQAGKLLGVGGWTEFGDQPAIAHQSAREMSVLTTARGYGARAGGEATSIRTGHEKKGWREGDSDIPSLAASKKDRQLSHLPGKWTPDVERARICAWEASPIGPVGDYEGQLLFDDTLQQSSPRQETTELHVKLQNEEIGLSPDDIDLHLFQTPRGDGDGEVVWLSASHQGEISSTSETAASESSRVAVKATGSSLHRRNTWVACWDATSKAIYYWDSESGTLTWDAPASVDGVNGFQSRVWDPQREAFFTVDEGGTSHWLMDSAAVEGWAAVDDAIGFGTTVPAVQVANSGRIDSSSTIPTPPSSWQSSGSTRAVEGNSPSTEAVSARDKAYITSTGEAEKETATGGAQLQATTATAEHTLRLSPSSLAKARHHFVGQSRGGRSGVGYRGEESSWSMSNVFPQEEGECEPEVGAADDAISAGEERPPLSPNATAASVVKNESAGDEDISDGVEFFDSRTCEDHCQLSAWVLWCTAPSLQDRDGPPYFVNEETGTSSWVLPPEAVATSGGWLRAWSEEHQAWFYANQWTGGVTWELLDVEVEGAADTLSIR